MKKSVLELSLSEISGSKHAIVNVIEVFSLAELSITINGLFFEGLFVLQINEHRDDFFRSWQVMFGNSLAKDLFFRTEQMKIEKSGSSVSEYKPQHSKDINPATDRRGIKS